MNKFLIILLVSTQAGLAQIQPAYLDTTYDFRGYADWILSIDTTEVPGEFYITGSESNFGVDFAEGFIGKLSGQGTISDRIILSYPDRELIGLALKEVREGEFLVHLQVYHISHSERQYGIALCNSSGIKWLSEYGDSTKWELSQDWTFTEDGNIVLTGSRLDTNSQDIWLIQVDTAGNLMWEQEIGLKTVQDYENSYGIVPTSDGGYMISGYRQYIGQNRFDALVVKTDSLGNQKWEKTFGNTGDRNWNEGIVSDGQGNYYACGFTQLTGSIHSFKARVIKLDEAGNVQWIKEYIDEDMGIGNYELETGIINAEGDIVFVGGMRDTTFGKDVGWLLKIKPDGEKVWSRMITHQTHDHQYLRDIEQTPDGGYLLVGSVFNQPNDAWVVKVDSVGCMVAGCDTIRTGISPVHVPEDFYMGDPVPNPTTGAVSISYQLPPGTSGQMQVVDIHGRLLQTHAVHASENQLELDLTALPALPGGGPGGLVFVSLRVGDRQPVTKAVMVE